MASLFPAQALIVPFTEDFSSGAANWLDGSSAAPTWSATGGVDGGGYISYTAPSFNSGSGSFGAPPLQIMFRANSSASGGAFVGDWLSGGVTSLSVAVRHNYDSALNLYARLDAGRGVAASLASDSIFTIAPNTWTTLNIPITDANPPFLSYGAGTFTSVFSGLQGMQFGLYLPTNTEFTNLRMEVTNASVVPEPTTSVLLVLAAGSGVALLVRRDDLRRKLLNRS